jgi:hypothetical protein
MISSNMARTLTAAEIHEIVRSSLKQNLGYICSMLDGVKVEIKVMREEVRKIPWGIEEVKERIAALEEGSL